MKFKSTQKFFYAAAIIMASTFAFADDNQTANNATTAPAATPSATGYWQTIDDTTNQPRSIVKICQLNDGNLYGRIIQVNYLAGEQPTDVCNLCSAKDPRYNQLNLGMVFLTDMQPNPNNNLAWDNGNVLDPKNGKVYDAKMKLTNDGKNLVLRGYIGISLLGRSQTWNQLTNDQVTAIIGKPLRKNLGGYFATTTGKYVATNYDSCAVMQAEVSAMTNAANPNTATSTTTTQTPTNN